MCPSCLQQGRVLRRETLPQRLLPCPARELPAPEVPMTTEELQKILQTEGYIAHVDDDGDLTFKAQGRTLYMTLSEDDPTYLRIFTDLTVPADKADELAVLREGNRLECKLKCVKCMLLDQDEERYFIRVAIECFSDTEILEEEITRYIDIVCAAHFELGQTLLM